MKRVILFFITVVMIICFAAPSFAYEFENENAPTEKELAEFAHGADWFLNLVFEGGIRSYYISGASQEWWNDPSNKRTNWAKEHGYVGTKVVKDPSVDELYWVNTHTGERTRVPKTFRDTMVAFHEDLTLEMIQKDLNSFFAYDSVFENINIDEESYPALVVDEEGRLYSPYWGREDGFSGIDWDKGEITVQRKNWIEVTVPDFDREYFTVEYTKTKNGWRISGGSYFEMYYDFGDFTPPETGDPTAPYLALSALSLLSLALAGAAVALGRKRKTL